MRHTLPHPTAITQASLTQYKTHYSIRRPVSTKINGHLAVIPRSLTCDEELDIIKMISEMR